MLIFIGLFSARAFAQETVPAFEIMNDIKSGKEISLKDVTITGDLDFTFMDDKQSDLPKNAKWWKEGKTNKVEETIGVAISFVNCEFEGDVLAYIHLEKSGYTFTADFDKNVTFKNCEFTENAMFKYSEFDNSANFKGSKFMRKSSFKYAEFDQMVSFSGAKFYDDANFKYTEFDEGVSFRNAVFDETLNIKYMDASGTFDIEGMQVEDVDAKYTKVNGKSFNAFLINNRN